MSLPNRYPEDELDHLVHGALKARVSGQEPPSRVWKNIKAELQTEGSPPPRPSRIAWAPLAVQAALTLLLVTIGGVALLGPNGLWDSQVDMSPSGTIAYVDERGASPAMPIVDDRAELRSLRVDFGSRPVSQQDAFENNPPIFIPRDVPPNVLYHGEDKTESEISSSLTVSEQNPKRSGPYPWYR